MPIADGSPTANPRMLIASNASLVDDVCLRRDHELRRPESSRGRGHHDIGNPLQLFPFVALCRGKTMPSGAAAATSRTARPSTTEIRAARCRASTRALTATGLVSCGWLSGAVERIRPQRLEHNREQQRGDHSSRDHWTPAPGRELPVRNQQQGHGGAARRIHELLRETRPPREPSPPQLRREPCRPRNARTAPLSRPRPSGQP